MVQRARRQVSGSCEHGVDKLEIKGTTLGFPDSSAIAEASFALRELRISAYGKPIRIFYAFDPDRDVVLLLGADKSSDERFYSRNIALVTRLWEDYLEQKNS